MKAKQKPQKYMWEERKEGIFYLLKSHRLHAQNEQHLRKLEHVLAVHNWKSDPWRRKMLACVNNINEDLGFFLAHELPAHHTTTWKNEKYYQLRRSCLVQQLHAVESFLSIFDHRESVSEEHAGFQAGIDLMKQAVHYVPDIRKEEKGLWRRILSVRGGFHE